MPGWTSPDDIGTQIDALQRRVRQLETYNASPLFADATLWQLVAQSTFPGEAGNWSSSWTLFPGTVLNYTLAKQQSVMYVAIIPWAYCYWPVGGPTYNMFLGYAFDGGSVTGAGVYPNYGIQSATGTEPLTIMVPQPHQSAGSHSVGIYYINDGSAPGGTQGNVYSSFGPVNPYCQLFSLGP